MLARRARCHLVVSKGLSEAAPTESFASEDVAVASAADSNSSAQAAKETSAGANVGGDIEERPEGSVGVVNLFQQGDQFPVHVAVILDDAEDGEYLLTFEYAPRNLELYKKVQKKEAGKLPPRRAYEAPRKEVGPPTTTSGIAREKCPDRRVIGGIKVSKRVGTLILTDDMFDLFSDMWTPENGTFRVFPGTSKLGDSDFPEHDTAFASGDVTLVLTDFANRKDEAALQRAMRQVTLKEMVTPAKTNIPLRKALPLLMAGENRSAFRTLGRFSIVMFTLPLIVLVVVRQLAAGNPNIDIYSGGAAILTVNIVLGVYALVAYRENVEEERQLQSASSSKEVTTESDKDK